MLSTVRLRQVTADDLEKIFEFEQDEEAARQVNFPSRSRERFMNHWNRNLANDANMHQAVLVDGEFAGNIVSWDQDGERMIGYWFGRAFWGRGIGTAAVRAFLDLEPRRPLYADPSVKNARSVRLLEKCGFQRVGSEMARDLYGDGEIEHILLKLD